MFLRLVLGLILLSSQLSFGHARGEDYIFTNFRENSIDGFFEINAFDLEKKFQIDIHSEGVDALAVLNENRERVQKYILKSFSIGPDTKTEYPIVFTKLEHRPPPAIPSGMYHFEIKTGHQPDQIKVRHNMFYETDPLHRGILVVSYNHKTQRNYGGEHTALAFNPQKSQQTLVLTDIPSLPPMGEIPSLGFRHILTHPEHLLHAALLALALASLFAAPEKLPIKKLSLVLFALILVTSLGFAFGNWFGLRIYAKGYGQFDSSTLSLLTGLTLLFSFASFLKFKFRPFPIIVLFGALSSVLGLFHGLHLSHLFGDLSIRLVRIKVLSIEFSKGLALSFFLSCLLALLLSFLFIKFSKNPSKVQFTLSLILTAATCYWLMTNQISFL